MKKYEEKYTEVGINSVKDVSTSSRRVKVAISRMGNIDLDKDMIDKNAYKRTIDTRGPKAANLIWHLTDHNASMKSAVGKFSELYPEGDYLMGVTDIPRTTWGNDMMEFYATGHINQHSVGFQTVKSENINQGKDNEYRLIKEIMLYEGSAVLWGANPDTPTMSVGKSMGSGMVMCPHCNAMTPDMPDENDMITCSHCGEKIGTKKSVEKDFFALITEMNNLHKLFKSGHFSDQTFEFLEMQLAQKTSKLEQLFRLATQPAVKSALDPVNEKMLGVLKTFNNSLIYQNAGYYS